MIIFASLHFAFIMAAAIWTYVRVPKWAEFEDSDGITAWYILGWIPIFGAAAVPIVFLWLAILTGRFN